MRIITGTAKGRNLKTPKGMSTRPTSDRVKESLFSILGGDTGGRVLDVFAGTGALGLEALSRGADSCVFIDKATADIISFNAEHTRLSDRCRVLKGDVFALLHRLAGQGERFDLVFCDPPYHQGLAHRVLEQLDKGDILAPDAIVVVEYGGDEADLPATGRLRLVREQSYGRTTRIGFYHLPPEAGRMQNEKSDLPGSFDPVTLGHVDIFQRAARIFDELYIGVFNNIRKTPLLQAEERMELLRSAVADLPNVKVVSFDGLLAEYMIANHIQVIVRGLRSVTDYEYEQGQAQIIKSMHPELDTIFLLGKPEYNSYSSSVVREIIRFKGDYSRLVPHEVVEYLNGKNSV